MGGSYHNRRLPWEAYGLLGGSWVVINGVISLLIWVLTMVTLHITPLISTHEPSSTSGLYANPVPRVALHINQWYVRARINKK